MTPAGIMSGLLPAGGGLPAKFRWIFWRGAFVGYERLPDSWSACPAERKAIPPIIELIQMRILL
ncbi:MAG: hypothetical protein COX16_00300 [Deltaproteobacteria bacterium CG23_combo_of_CG06-09_8_20_14_all_51_20]|nr:MAG: hypothetical protein AUK25_01660 [Desulfobacteraceae bacterium CG2_30_51_40]PIP48671.1 MAG: hypothetical protein COX16_00300 [Deltaproteobacteria bacterium CG23_combo_of_CG06-09_8_20_14_all_51_20]PIW01476.1 MAG: hypothetical protein COW41_02480 [Deltaproteobacteria bacterium CG17_big_fil_post_rev_8_21_14_2_50_51_6]PIY26780.1 MAG: hypothetical protein COZ11_01765 [Deltaproteobacteria bacterium CG_4_10_14_3_um_filter_51_14]PJB34770.1 MAG: hypothetical protein CO107_12395 [Deltaproteobacte